MIERSSLTCEGEVALNLAGGRRHSIARVFFTR
jgi:hypothetical protein